MARPAITPIDQERPFDFNELFFSTTDPKGVILSGNQVFVRVSGYNTVEELIGKPHNVIRHPDMPRAIFKLLWEYLGERKPFIGYVKNLATDGCYYWVMALVVPTQGGFFSVRFKPSGSYFDLARDLYAELLAIERGAGDWREGMQAAGERLSALLTELGFANYSEFMNTALASEMAGRRARQGTTAGDATPLPSGDKQGKLASTLQSCHAVDRQLDDLCARVESFLDLIRKLEEKSAYLCDLSKNVRLVSINALTASYRLNQAGRGLAIVTHELATVSERSTNIIGELTAQTLVLTSALRETAAHATGAKLQVEMTIFFATELLRMENHEGVADSSLNRARADLLTLEDSFARSIARMLAALPRAQEPIIPLLQLRDRLIESLRLLSSVHISGKIQATHLAEAGHFHELFDQIFAQLHVAQKELQELSGGLLFLTDQLPDLERAGRFIQQSLGDLQAFDSTQLKAA